MATDWPEEPRTGPDWQQLLAFDRDHVWHPYAPLPAANAALPVVSASGTRLRLADGRELVDGMSSWWTAIWGYRHPVIDAALQEQMAQMSHVMFGGLTHAGAIKLAKRLTEMAPPGLDRVFFAESGSVSIEVALKTAVQYQRNRGQSRRAKFVALSGGYHGDTLGAMSVCDPVGGMHHLFAGALPTNFFAPRPPSGKGAATGWEQMTARVLGEHGDLVAAIIAEPVVQGAGGMWFYDPACLKVLRRLADEHGALLILDEIATGFGRTGAMFASLTAGVKPDIMCVGKALTGGYLSLAAMLCTAEVAEAASGGEAGCLMHGPTYMANPLACAAGLASTGLLLGTSWQPEVKRIEARLAEALEPASAAAGVKDVRVLGAIGVVQLEHPVDVASATGAAISKGVWLRPFRDLVYAMPPYVSSDEDLALIGNAVRAAISA
ncbi:MAG TPA: adenosylmethionine--8-amino-7-oxononanoate transaminase [Acidimicrobiales bacterium]|nr:adenosylmethionine--8-amino-7-oxononanoate transaminase [Acidimicrobiales bacterium]